MSAIKKITATVILDSRGEKTVEATVETNAGILAKASVPRGKSTGSREAKYVPADEAARNAGGFISDALKGIEVSAQNAVDAKLLEIDGTADKSRLGANAILGVSMACARTAAKEKGVPLWKHLSEIFSGGEFGAFGELRGELWQSRRPKMPFLFMNMINGGLHAGNNLEFQEYLVIPQTRDVKKGMEAGVKIYGKLKEILTNDFGERAGNIGDEGGFAPDFSNDASPFEYLARASEDASVPIRFGMDAAASSVKKKSAELSVFYRTLFAKFNLLYLEDPFAEDDVSDFAELTAAVGARVIIAGDDLTATNLSRMREVARARAVNGVIVKPNQIGTLTETFEAIKFAEMNGWEVIVSHRSGETDDDFIADLAYAVGAYGFKLGAPARRERLSKYNRLLEISNEISI